MISKGSTIVLQTREAIYSTCQVVTMSADNVTVRYFAGTKKDRATGKWYDDFRIESVSRRKIVLMSERC